MIFNNSSIYLGSNIPAYLMDCSMTVPLSSDGLSLEVHFMENNFHTLLKQSFPDNSDVPTLIKERNQLNNDLLNIFNPININRFYKYDNNIHYDNLFFLEMLYEFNDLESFTTETIFSDERSLDAIKKFKNNDFLKGIIETINFVISYYKPFIDSYEPKESKANTKKVEDFIFLPNTIMMYIRHTNVILVQNEDLNNLKQNIYTDVSKHIPKITKNRDMLQRKINHYHFFLNTDFEHWFSLLDFENPDDLVHIFKTMYLFIDLFKLD